MPITRISPEPENEQEVSIDVFQIQEAIEVYDGALALAIDHLLNHIKALVSLAYLPGGEDLTKALKRHPLLRHLRQDGALSVEARSGRSADRVLLEETKHLLNSIMEIAHLAAWPETADQAREELEVLERRVPFLDYRYENDPYPSDRDHEE